MKKVRIGVIGAGRGKYLAECIAEGGHAEHAELVAVCDKWAPGLKELDGKCATYTDYDEFLKHDMDAVLLANYANEHAPFAIKAMNNGKHVISEVLPCQNMKEAVELVETVERTGRIYCYAENYCYMGGPREMRRLYREGKIGDFEYGEGEYIHNCETIWPIATYGRRDHWRNSMHAFFYCTHSLGPLIHITGLRPVKVTGFELPFNDKLARVGKRTGSCGIEMVTLENGAVLKSIHGELYRDSVWYTIYGSKGRIESARESAECNSNERVYLEAYEEAGNYDPETLDKRTYIPTDEFSERAAGAGHGGSDFYCLWNAIEKIAGNSDVDTIDVYEAMDMGLPGLFAYRSVLNGGIPMDVPNMRVKEERDKWRNDTLCTIPEVAGDMLVPSYSKGTPEIPDAVYEKIRKEWYEKSKSMEER